MFHHVATTLPMIFIILPVANRAGEASMGMPMMKKNMIMAAMMVVMMMVTR